MGHGAHDMKPFIPRFPIYGPSPLVYYPQPGLFAAVTPLTLGCDTVILKVGSLVIVKTQVLTRLHRKKSA